MRLLLAEFSVPERFLRITHISFASGYSFDLVLSLVLLGYSRLITPASAVSRAAASRLEALVILPEGNDWHRQLNEGPCSTRQVQLL